MYKCEFRADTKIVFDFELLMYLKRCFKEASQSSHADYILSIPKLKVSFNNCFHFHFVYDKC